MTSKVNPAWQKEIMSNLETDGYLDFTSSYNASIQWLIQELSERKIPFKLHQLGAGVKRVITKDIDTCPCCKKKLISFRGE